MVDDAYTGVGVDIARELPIFADVYRTCAGSYEANSIQISVDGSQKAVTEAKVGPAFFKTARILPLLGCGFLPEEHNRAAAVVILSYKQWQDSFGGNPSCIGKQILIDGSAMTIVGVMPQSFDFPSGVGVWIPRG